MTLLQLHSGVWSYGEGLWTRVLCSILSGSVSKRETLMTSEVQIKFEEQEQEAEHHLLEDKPTPPAVSLSWFTYRLQKVSSIRRMHLPPALTPPPT